MTDLCSRAAEQLTFSQPMITIDEFNLFDAMSAVEVITCSEKCPFDLNFYFETLFTSVDGPEDGPVLRYDLLA